MKLGLSNFIIFAGYREGVISGTHLDPLGWMWCRV